MAVVSAPSDLLIFLFIQDKPTELLTLNLQFFILLLSYALGCVFLCIHFVPQYFCITDGIQPQFQIIASEILCAWPLPFTSATSTSISLKTPLLYYVESLCCCHLVAKLCPNLCDPMNCSPPGSSFHRVFPGKNIGVSCHFLLQASLVVQTVKNLQCKRPRFDP